MVSGIIQACLFLSYAYPNWGHPMFVSRQNILNKFGDSSSEVAEGFPARDPHSGCVRFGLRA